MRQIRLLLHIKIITTTPKQTNKKVYLEYFNFKRRSQCSTIHMIFFKAFARVPRWATEIFETDPQERSDTDCRRIHALLRGLKSFDKFTEQIQLSMCKSFSYQRYVKIRNMILCVNFTEVNLQRNLMFTEWKISRCVFRYSEYHDSRSLPMIK